MNAAGVFAKVVEFAVRRASHFALVDGPAWVSSGGVARHAALELAEAKL